MIRLIVENIILFLLPTGVYFAYRYLAMGAERSAEKAMDGAPYVGLFATGAVLVLAVIAIFGENDGGRPGQTYVPPVFKDGRIEPGHFK